MRGSAEEVLYKEWKRRRPAERMFDWSECAEQRRNELQKLSGNATDTNQHGGMKPDSPIQRGLDALLGCGQMIPINLLLLYTRLALVGSIPIRDQTYKSPLSF